MVLFDDRENSATKGKFQELTLSPINYFGFNTLKHLNGFKGEDIPINSLNCLDLPHDEKEMVRLKPEDKNSIINGNN